MLFLGGSEGGRPDPAYARLLASHGYAVLALAYFGVDGLPDTLEAIRAEYGLTAARWLANRSEVADGPIGVCGASRGGDYALLVASTAPEWFAAVVSVVGSDLVWPALTFDPGRPRSSWTRGGAELPFWSPAATAAKQEAARIRSEAITAPVLFVSAGADGLLPSQTAAERALAAIEVRGNPHHARHLHYPHAGHLVGGCPDLPTTVTIVSTSEASLPLDVGGEPAATAHAVSTTHAAVLDLFARALPTNDR